MRKDASHRNMQRVRACGFDPLAYPDRFLERRPLGLPWPQGVVEIHRVDLDLQMEIAPRACEFATNFLRLRVNGWTAPTRRIGGYLPKTPLSVGGQC